MDRRTFVQTGAVAISVAVAGCTGSMDGGGEDGTDDGGSGSQTVTMSGTSFQPRTLRVDPGTTVTWTNDGSAGHNVIAERLTSAGADWSFSSELLGSGDSTTYTFEESGAYEYFCSIHGKSTMCGVVIVGDVSYDGTLPCADDSGGGGVY